MTGAIGYALTTSFVASVAVGSLGQIGQAVDSMLLTVALALRAAGAA